MIISKSSNWRDVISDVPQGSVLGPILFLIYVNEIDEDLTYKISKFADDTKITSKVTITSEKLQFQSNTRHLSQLLKKVANEIYC